MKYKTKEDYVNAVYRIMALTTSARDDVEALTELIEDYFLIKRNTNAMKKYLRRKCEHIAKASGKGKPTDYMRYMLGPYFKKQLDKELEIERE